jgi:hypothetical protein
MHAQEASSPAAVPSGDGRTSAPPPENAKEPHEDWGSIFIQKGVLEAAAPVLGEKDDVSANKFIRERYQVIWRDGDPLDLFVIRPRDVAKPPVILYLYSFPQDTDRFKDDGWCSRVTDGGFAAIGFVSALTGHRFHDRSMKEWFISELQEALGTSVHDVPMILDYLATRGDLDMNDIGMFGQGSGGAIAILAAAADPRIKVLDLHDPWGDWPDWIAKSDLIPDKERPDYEKPQFLARVATLDPAQWLPKLSSRSIRIQDLRQEVNNPEKCQKVIEAAAPEATVIDQFGDARAEYRANSGGRIFDWAKHQLRPSYKPDLDSERTQRITFHPPEGETIH